MSAARSAAVLLTLAFTAGFFVRELRLALKTTRLKVKGNEYKKDAASSDYFPTITNQSSACTLASSGP